MEAEAKPPGATTPNRDVAVQDLPERMRVQLLGCPHWQPGLKPFQFK